MNECDHKMFAEKLKVCIEGKCCGCGQIKFRKTLEECYAGKEKIEVI